MDLRDSIYGAMALAGKDTGAINWNLDSGLSGQGAYTVADLAAAVDYPPAFVGWTLTADMVTAAWSQILRDQWDATSAGDDVGAFTLAADVATIVADGVQASTVTVAPASGAYGWSLWLEGVLVASSATLGLIDLADGYAVEIAVSAAGTYTLRVIQDGKYKQIAIAATEA